MLSWSFVCLLSDYSCVASSFTFPGLWSHGGSRGGLFPAPDWPLLSRPRLFGSRPQSELGLTPPLRALDSSARGNCVFRQHSLKHSTEPGPEVCVACYRYAAIVVCIGSNPTLWSSALLKESVRVWVSRSKEHWLDCGCVRWWLNWRTLSWVRVLSVRYWLKLGSCGIRDICCILSRGLLTGFTLSQLCLMPLWYCGGALPSVDDSFFFFCNYYYLIIWKCDILGLS